MPVGRIQDMLGRVIGWLRAGYPEGVPNNDYVALLGILRRRLTADEVEQIAGALAEASAPGDPIGEDDIRDMIRSSVLETASDDDVARVSAHLAAGGWPLADVE